MTPTDVETVYDALAEALDAAGEARHALFLAKLALLLARDVGDVGRVVARIAEAGLDLEA